MTGNFRGAIVAGMEIMRGNRELGQTPGLVDADLTDDVGRTRATPGVGTVDARHELSGRTRGHVPEVRLTVVADVSSCNATEAVMPWPKSAV